MRIFLDEDTIIFISYFKEPMAHKSWNHYITMSHDFSILYSSANAVSILLFVIPRKSSLYN